MSTRVHRAEDSYYYYGAYGRRQRRGLQIDDAVVDYDDVKDFIDNDYDYYYNPNQREFVEQYFSFNSPYAYWPSLCFYQAIDFESNMWHTRLDYRDCSDIAYESDWYFQKGEGPLREDEGAALEEAYDEGFYSGYE